MASTGTLQVAAAGATQALAQMGQGLLSSEAHVSGLLATVRDLEPEIGAWAHLDAAGALAQARHADRRRAAGEGAPLLGVAVGVKDIIDTADMPTENGTPLHAGRRPQHDAALVTRLRQAGAVILGKTVTTELATYAPGKTRNPHRTSHTPGGSSSGSAAAVACGMVPLAIGSQTNGSTIRPGSYCATVSFKPTRASVDRAGMLVQSPSFDAVGLFARHVQDVELLWRVLSRRSTPGRREAPGPKTLLWFLGPLGSELEPGVEPLLAQCARALGADRGPPDLPVPLRGVIGLHKVIMEAEIADSFRQEHERGAAHLSASLRGQIERGRATTRPALNAARAELERARTLVDEWMRDQAIDALVVPSATGPAPAGLGSTGDPIFCTLATALDLPALQLPLLQAPNGLPLGIQLVGRRCDDEALLTLGAQAMAGSGRR